LKGKERKGILKGATDNAERLSLFVLVTRGAIPLFQPFSHNSLSRKKSQPTGESKQSGLMSTTSNSLESCSLL
jgi:hypothetical protein